MPDADFTLLLSRLQFAITIGLHIVLAAFALGLALFLALLEGKWLYHHDKCYLQTYRFWLKVFAYTTAVGAVTGVVMEFQFGTNWGPFAQKTGGIIGPLMFMEVVLAFFLESALAGVMVFGMGRIPAWAHFIITCLVAAGALISAFWILAANSWMQTPTGFTLGYAGQFQPESWLTILRAPSFPWRFMHMVLAALLGTAFLVAGVGAWRLLNNLQKESAKKMISLAMWLAVILMPVQIVIGDLQGENTLKYQPQKVAAMEGSWHRPQPGEGEPVRLFALPDQKAQRNTFEVAVPQLASLYLRHNLTGHIQALSEFPVNDIPHVFTVFMAFRVMVGLGILMLATALTALCLRWQHRLYTSRRLLKCLLFMSPAGFLAMLAGWVVTETGRQPWTVWGLMRTDESFSTLPAGWVIASASGITLIYAFAFITGLRYFLHYIATEVPVAEEGEDDN